ncbi:hypothetical protein FHX49_000607 [Microbacterium endophyticum]|uniref:Uncharacterized protein n=1 Tax=Microbacterium endophyticum TaxID=1526412 RepID=A0A7W4V1F4_9MICO|nr:hypothetical protein [Microbacterium endophyticum]MBB2975066.1 hypothetical protein [Microbacterium endophyticum]NIK37394.1 hypothetical protein [Microbacterium endophyticum]
MGVRKRRNVALIWAAGIVGVALLSVRAITSLYAAGEKYDDIATTVLILVLTVVVCFVGYGWMVLVYRHNSFGGLGALRERHPAAMIFVSMIRVDQREVLDQVVSSKRALRLPVYYSMVVESRQMLIYKGKRFVGSMDLVDTRFEIGRVDLPFHTIPALRIRFSNRASTALVMVPLSKWTGWVPEMMKEDLLGPMVDQLNRSVATAE